MYRLFAVILTAALASSPAFAQDRTPSFGPAQKLIFVSETQFPGPHGTQSLCVHVTDFHVLFMPLSRDVGGYGFSPDQCTGGAIHEIPTDRFAMFQSAGIIPKDLPETPIAPLDRTWQSAIPIVLLGLSLVGLFIAYRRRFRAATPEKVSSASSAA